MVIPRQAGQQCDDRPRPVASGSDAEDEGLYQMEGEIGGSHEVELNMLLTESYSNFWMFDRAACCGSG